MGATLKVTGGLADIIGVPGKRVPAPPPASAAPAKTEAWLATLGPFDDRPPVPACIALGPEADAVIDALRVRARASWDDASHMAGWDIDCFRTGRDDPAGLDRWIETRLRPCDFIALVVDAKDPATRDQVPGWADRLAGLEEAALRIAFIVGDAARDPDAPWRALRTQPWMACSISAPSGGSCAPRRLPPMSMACCGPSAPRPCRCAVRRPVRAQTPVRAAVAAMPAAPVQ